MIERAMTEIEHSRLSALATSINVGHSEVIRKGWEAVEHAIQVGKDLMEARTNVPNDGVWGIWFQQNIQMDWSTAYRYMRVAEHEHLVLRGKPQTIADALRLVAGEPRRGVGPREYTPEEIKQIRELVPKIGIKNTAKQLGMSRSTVHKYALRQSSNQAKRRRLTPDLAQLDAWAEEVIPSPKNIRSAVGMCASIGRYEHWLRLAAYALAKARELKK